jgi:hypothetical protein
MGKRFNTENFRKGQVHTIYCTGILGGIMIWVSTSSMMVPSLGLLASMFELNEIDSRRQKK